MTLCNSVSLYVSLGHAWYIHYLINEFYKAFIDGFLIEINDLCHPPSYRYKAYRYCHFIWIYVDMNMALLAQIYQVWSEFETYEVFLKTFPGKRECG